MKHRYTIACLFSALLLAAGAQACPDGPPGKHGKMFDSLDLTEEQEAALNALHKEKRASFHDRRAHHDDIQQLIEEGQVEAAADLAAENARQHIRSRAEFQSKLAEILTPEQMEQFKAEKGERHKHHKKMFRKKMSD